MSDELQAILKAWGSGEQAEPSVLATVVEVHGSAYRRPGARMLIHADGSRIGTISGGCLEGDVVKKAAWWTAGGRPVLRTYDTSSEEAAWEFGLGCNGVISVLVERFSSASVEEMLAFIEEHQDGRKGCVIATVIRTQPGTIWSVGDRLLWSASGLRGGSLLGTGLETDLVAEVRSAASEARSRVVRLPAADVFVEWVAPPQRLVIFGAGHDVMPLVSFAAEMGWRITVADGRPAYARACRFPGAEQVATIPPSSDISGIPIDSSCAVVMMTHNYPQDRKLLPQILARTPRYLGMLGPRSRTESLFAEIGDDLLRRDPYSPVGLDLGSDRPESVALSIVAEIQAVLSGRTGGSLKWRRGPIHHSMQVSGDSRHARHEEQVTLTACETMAVADA